jgi:hypothetical protein
MPFHLSLMTGHLLQIAGGLLLVYLYYKNHIRFLYHNRFIFILGTFLIFFGIFRMILIME